MSGDIVIDSSTTLRPRGFANEQNVYQLIDKNRAYLSKWVKWATDYSPEKLHQDITETLEETAAGTLFIFDIFYNGEYVGAVDAHEVAAGQSAELGYYLAEHATGKGLATRCTQKLMDFLQENFNIHHFFLEITEGNEPSVNVAKRLGFTPIGKHYDDDYGTTEHRYEKFV